MPLSSSAEFKWGKNEKRNIGRDLWPHIYFYFLVAEKSLEFLKMVNSGITAEEACSKAILGPRRKGEKDRNGKKFERKIVHAAFLCPLWRISARESGLTENHLRRLYCQAQALQAAKVLNYHETSESKSLSPRRLLAYPGLFLYLQKCFYS